MTFVTFIYFFSGWHGGQTFDEFWHLIPQKTQSHARMCFWG